MDATNPGESGEVELNVVLQPLDDLARVTGRVVDTGLNPVVGEAVQLMSSSVGVSYRAVTGPGGAFTLDGVEPAGDYDVRMDPHGPYGDYIETGVQVRPAGLALDIVLEALVSGHLSGQMIDAEGFPVGGFTLWLRSSEAGSRFFEVHGDTAGRFAVEDVPFGDLILQTRSLPEMVVTGLILEPGGNAHATVILDWGDHRLSGWVIDPAGDPVAAPQVTLTAFHELDGVRSRSTRRSAAGVEGDFAFTRLGPGPHTLHVAAPGYAPARLEHYTGLDDAPVLVRLEPATP